MRARIARGRGAATRRSQSSARRSRSTSPTRRSGPGSSRASRTCSAWPSEPPPDREDLFSAWRLFFERLAEQRPVVLVFEDLHWADAALLDFVEYLLEWSRSHPLFVLALARPELLERRPTFGAGGRNATTLSLEPLSERAMEELLDGFVPGLPDELRAQILGRAEGVPLYAVETVRMLLDRGLLERRRRRLPTDGRDRGARRARDAARARRRAARRSRRPRSGGCSRTPPSSARRSRRRASSALSGPVRGRSSSPLLTSLVRKEVLSRPGRSSLARARPVRLPPGPAQARRLRDARRSPSGRPATSRRPRTWSRPSGRASRRSSR